MNKTRLTGTVLISATFLTAITNYLFFGLISERSDRGGRYTVSPWLFYRLNSNSITLDSDEDSITAPVKINDLKLDRIAGLFNCSDKDGAGTQRVRKKTVRRTYTVVTNFVMASRSLACDDPSITYTTHGDFRYLDNLVPVVERWKGPISLALYIPGPDVAPTLQRIAFMRECTTPLIKEWVTFHLFSDTRYFKDPIPVWNSLERAIPDTLCSNVPEFGDQMPSSRKTKKILYPVNVARNVAREQAQTQFVLASDLELYPSLNFIPSFFEMLSRERDFFLNRTVPFVFVLPIFEVEEGLEVPESREELLDLIDSNSSVTFHRYVCPECHEVPHYAEWLLANTTRNQLNVFYTAKRRIPYKYWEPIFVSSNNVPFYDERLSWEGLRDKMTQSFTFCILDYDFMILDNAFLIHKPGIKFKKHNLERPKYPIRRQNRMLNKIMAEIARRLGEREGCSLY